ncbi:MAG: acyltransferase [Promethearchaeota archaeon Loki_b32]|nr:MAG: acyltransferase [Candidatus Lokiarchaeota archaeon Loki_b32]
MKVGYIQASPIFGEKEKNFEQVKNLISDIKADLLVLPELFTTGYTFTSKKEAESFAEGLEGPTAYFLIELSKKINTTIVGGFVEKFKDEIFNSAMIVSRSEVLGVYRKLHLYNKEKLWFSPGNKPPKIYKIEDVNIGIMICFDWIFPETARSLALLGADIIAHPANLVLPYCQKAMVTRCLENRVYAITANRVGEEKRGDDHFKFTGKSQITSYNGGVLSSAPNNEIHVDFVDIDITKARDKNLNDYNNLFEDRHIEFYYNTDK